MSCIWESNLFLNKGNTFKEVKKPVDIELIYIREKSLLLILTKPNFFYGRMRENIGFELGCLKVDQEKLDQYKISNILKI